MPNNWPSRQELRDRHCEIFGHKWRLVEGAPRGRCRTCGRECPDAGATA